MKSASGPPIDCRRATSDDLSFVAAADRSHSPVFRDRASYERLLGDDGLVLVALKGQDPVGFAAFCRVLDEAELLNLVVLPAARRRGCAAALMHSAEGLLRENGVRRLLLEVRPSNGPARRFYECCGFTVDGRRRAYYPATAEHPAEDALLMSLPVGSPSLAAGRVPA
ncbi:MAG: GNAT family N-acetyltransferase [Halieaceae bacterium]|jgi:ribosomal-protein-alanine N-acetyltransferase|nr:GNAT family N-acetyltransferase [Halieaceae bacterium]